MDQPPDTQPNGPKRRSLVLTVLQFVFLTALLFSAFGLTMPDRYPTPLRADGLTSIAVTSLILGVLCGIVSWYFQRNPPQQRKLTRDEAIVWLVVIVLLVGVTLLAR